MLKYNTIYGLAADVGIIHHWLSPHFSMVTAVPGTVAGSSPSTGHCAVAAIIMRSIFGGALISTTVQGESHWFNRIDIDGFVVDVDITGDQFDLEAVQIGPVDALYDVPATIRTSDEIENVIISRDPLLADQAHLSF